MVQHGSGGDHVGVRDQRADLLDIGKDELEPSRAEAGHVLLGLIEQALRVIDRGQRAVCA